MGSLVATKCCNATLVKTRREERDGGFLMTLYHPLLDKVPAWCMSCRAKLTRFTAPFCRSSNFPAKEARLQGRIVFPEQSFLAIQRQPWAFGGTQEIERWARFNVYPR